MCTGGDWAGLPQFFNALGGCPGDCASEYLHRSSALIDIVRYTDFDPPRTAFVNQNPSAFNDAFWDIAGVHVYA